MVTNATGGPNIVYGQLPVVPGTTYQAEYNNLAAPSMFWGGIGLLDSRWGYVAQGGQPHALGFQGSTYIPTLNGIPNTASTSILAASQTPTTAVALVLSTQSTTSITVLATALQVYPSLNTVPVGAIALDGVPGVVTFNANGTTLSTTAGGVQLYDPTKALARNVRIQTSGADTSGSYLVSGFDIYGYPMSENISGTTNASGGIQSGKKAFKFVTSIVPKGTIVTTTLSVGTGDVIGLPLRADGMGDISVYVNATEITSSAGFVAAVTTAATTASGDVRGTYALQVASNGVEVVQIFETPRAANIGSVTGLFGVTQA